VAGWPPSDEMDQAIAELSERLADLDDPSLSEA
jgi:hypothetical protein